MGTKRKTKRPSLDLNDVRIAVHHLIELAAGVEGRGADAALRRGEKSGVLARSGWEPIEEDETFDDDRRTLKKVVDLLLAHRRRQQEAQRNAFIEGLTFVLSHVYRAYARDADMTALTLETKLKAFCDQLSLEVGDEEMLVLAPERGGADDADVDGEADTIHAMEGAVEAAKKIVSKLVGLSFRRIREIRDEEGHPLAFARRPFGRYIPRQGRLRYVTDLFAELERVTASPSIAFHELRTFEEATAVAVDRVVENLMARAVEESAFRAAVLPKEAQARIEAAEAEDAAKLRVRVDELVQAGPAAIASSDLPESIRAAALEIAEAAARDAPTHERASLDAALAGSIRAVAHQILVDAMRVAALDTFGAELDTIRKP